MRSATSRWRRWRGGIHYHVLFWQFLPVAIIFYAACLVHTGLGIWALYERRQFRWKAIEPLQLVLGLSIPALILRPCHWRAARPHAVRSRQLYPQVFFTYWVVLPPDRLAAVAVADDLLDAWQHRSLFLAADAGVLQDRPRRSCWPRRSWCRRWRCSASIRAAAPSRDSESAEWRADNLPPDKVGTAAQADTLETITDYFLIGYLGLLGFVLLARAAFAPCTSGAAA